MTPICWPPFLTVSQQSLYVSFHRFKIQCLNSRTMIVIRIHRINASAALVQNVQIQRIWPPLGDRLFHRSVTAMRKGASPSKIAVHFYLLFSLVVVLVSGF